MLFWVPLVVFRKSSKWNNTLNQKKKKLKEREIEIDLILYYTIFHLFLILSINTTHITVAKTSSGIFNSLSLFPFSVYICGDELPKKVLSALEVLSHIGELSLPPLTYKRWAYVGGVPIMCSTEQVQQTAGYAGLHSPTSPSQGGEGARLVQKAPFLLFYSFWIWSAKIPKFKFYYFDFWFTLFLVLLGIEQKSSQQFEKWRRMAQIEIEIEIGGKSSTFQTSLPYRPTSNNPLVNLLYQYPHSYILLLSPSLLLLFNTTQYIHSIFIFHKLIFCVSLYVCIVNVFASIIDPKLANTLIRLVTF